MREGGGDQWTFPLIVRLLAQSLFVLAVVAAVAAYGWIRVHGAPEAALPLAKDIEREVFRGGHRLGSPHGAELVTDTVVVFSSYGCPVCAEWTDSLRAYGDSLSQFVVMVKNIAVEGPFPGPFEAAVAAECAAAQGAFDRLHQALFGLSDYSTSSLLILARKHGLRESAFGECLQDDAPADVIRDHSRLAMDLEIKGTPTTVVANWMLTGVQSLRSLERWAGKRR